MPRHAQYTAYVQYACPGVLAGWPSAAAEGTSVDSLGLLHFV